MTHKLPDPRASLYLERTELAWQRTSLAFTIGVLAGARLFVDQIESWSVVAICAGVSCAAVFSAAGRARYGSQRLRPTGVPWAAGALPLVTLAGAVVSLGLVGLAVSLVRFF